MDSLDHNIDKITVLFIMASTLSVSTKFSGSECHPVIAKYLEFESAFEKFNQHALNYDEKLANALGFFHENYELACQNLQDLKKSYTTLSLVITELNMKICNLDEQISKSVVDENSVNEIASLTEQINALTASLEKEKTDYSEKMKQLFGKILNEEIRFDVLRAECLGNEKRLSELNSIKGVVVANDIFSNVVTDLTSFESDIRNYLQVAISDVNSASEYLKHEMARSKERFEKLKAESTDVKNTSLEYQSCLSQKTLELQTKKSELETTVNSVSETKQQLKESRTKLVCEKNESCEKMEQLQREINVMEDKMSKCFNHFVSDNFELISSTMTLHKFMETVSPNVVLPTVQDNGVTVINNEIYSTGLTEVDVTTVKPYVANMAAEQGAANITIVEEIVDYVAHVPTVEEHNLAKQVTLALAAFVTKVAEYNKYVRASSRVNVEGNSPAQVAELVFKIINA